MECFKIFSKGTTTTSWVIVILRCAKTKEEAIRADAQPLLQHPRSIANNPKWRDVIVDSAPSLDTDTGTANCKPFVSSIYVFSSNA